MTRVGIDLERIDRFSFILKPIGQAFYRRVYTIHEQIQFGTNLKLLTLAFTAKEAISKLLGTGLSINSPDIISCQEIEIIYDPGLNQPTVNLVGKAQTIAQALDLSDILIHWGYNTQLAYTLAISPSNLVTVAELETELTRCWQSNPRVNRLIA